MIKMVIFDLDGTLVDSLTDLALNVNRGLRAVGLPAHPVERYRTFVGNGRTMLVRRAMGDAADDSEKFDRVTEVFNREYALHCHDNTAAYPGCGALLDGLAAHGILTAVLSNKPDEFVGRILQKADSDVDVFTAQNGGMQMAGVSWGFRGKAELQNAGAPFVADTAAELLAYLVRL